MSRAWVEDSAESPALRVSEVAEILRAELRELGPLRIEGEVASLHRSRLGHVYFNLKDDECRLSAVIYRRTADELELELEEGMQVRVTARLDLYAARGQLQLVVTRVEPCGEGALRLAFERLRQRLAEEGLFDPAHKRPLPFFPRRIGLVTSRGGAALHDVVRGLRRRALGCELVLCDARVQGDEAWRELVRGLHRLAADPRVEVIVLARGGGSLEDLWNFNREELVRAIFELETPVVSAIGHEVDLVLTDLVADARAATPTSAAELVLPDGAALRRRCAEVERRLLLRQRAQLRELGHRLDALRRGLVHPARRLAELGRGLVQLRERLERALGRGLERHESGVRALGARLHARSPLGVLERGSAIARREPDGAVLRSSDEVEPGAGLHVRLHRGALLATVTGRLDEEAER